MRSFESLRFVVAGSFLADCHIVTERIPDWGEDLRAEAIRTALGGKASTRPSCWPGTAPGYPRWAPSATTRPAGLAAQGITEPIEKIDWTGVYWRKGAASLPP
jgi:hypothetical protein